MIKPVNVVLRCGAIITTLQWNTNYGTVQTARFKAAQSYIDKECVKRMQPLVPVALSKYPNAGKLAKSVKIVSPGHIYYMSEHSRYSYYNRANHKHGGNPKAVRMWFEPMKRQYKTVILRGAAAIVGGRAK